MRALNVCGVVASTLLLAVSCSLRPPEDSGGGEDSPVELQPPRTEVQPPRDADADGWTREHDCDDDDADIHPAADDATVDGVDQDCSGVDGVDDDGDGWASEASGGTDCDDTRSETYLGAPEACGGAVDSNCDGELKTCASLTREDAVAEVWSDEPIDPVPHAFSLEQRLPGDLNGDGNADLLLSINDGASIRGLYGPLDGVKRLEDTPGWDLRPRESMILGIPYSADLNGDGTGDIIVSEYEWGYPYGNTVYLFYGPLSGMSDTTQADVALTQAHAGLAGSAGDLDGDGRGDILINYYRRGGRSFVPSPGIMYGGSLESGSLDALVATTVTGTPSSVVRLRPLGDLDGDGVDDLWAENYPEASSPTSAVFFSPLPPGTHVDISDGDIVWAGGSGDEYTKRSYAVTDVDGDGRDDLVLEHGTNDNTFGIHTNVAESMLELAEAPGRIRFATQFWQLGASADHDGDGFSEIWMSCVWGNCERRLLAFSGPLYGTHGATSAILSVTPPDETFFLGDGGSAGDLDGDGWPEFLLIAPPTQSSAHNALFVYPGSLYAD